MKIDLEFKKQFGGFFGVIVHNKKKYYALLNHMITFDNARIILTAKVYTSQRFRGESEGYIKEVFMNEDFLVKSPCKTLVNDTYNLVVGIPVVEFGKKLFMDHVDQIEKLLPSKKPKKPSMKKSKEATIESVSNMISYHERSIVQLKEKIKELTQ